MSKVSAANKTVLFDVIYLNEGQDIKEALDYFHTVSTIAATHGLVMEDVFVVKETLRGNITQPALINIWRLDRPDAMQKMGADPKYQKMIPQRDSLFQMKELSLFKAENV